jgi:hypothetical protein
MTEISRNEASGAGFLFEPINKKKGRKTGSASRLLLFYAVRVAFSTAMG